MSGRPNTGFAHVGLGLTKVMSRLAPPSRLDGLKIMVVGLGDHVSREVIGALHREGAKVTVTGVANEVELLRRDLELTGAQASLAPLETIDATEARLLADELRALGQLPSVVVCCSAGVDVQAALLIQALQPTLALHLDKTAPTGSRPFAGRALADLLDDPGLFDTSRTLSRVRLGARLFQVRRRDHVFAARAARRPATHPSGQAAEAIRHALRPQTTPAFFQGDQA